MQTDADRMADSRAALERKAAIYERMAAGVEDDETDTYNVDFFTKAGDLDDEATRLAREAHHRASRPHTEGVPDTAGDAVWATGNIILRHRLLAFLPTDLCDLPWICTQEHFGPSW